MKNFKIRNIGVVCLTAYFTLFYPGYAYARRAKISTVLLGISAEKKADYIKFLNLCNLQASERNIGLLAELDNSASEFSEVYMPEASTYYLFNKILPNLAREGILTEETLPFVIEIGNSAYQAGLEPDFLFRDTFPSLKRAGILTKTNLLSIGSKLVDLNKVPLEFGFYRRHLDNQRLIKAGILTESNLSLITKLARSVYQAGFNPGILFEYTLPALADAKILTQTNVSSIGKQLVSIGKSLCDESFTSDYLFGNTFPSLARSGILTEENLIPIAEQLIDLGKEAVESGINPSSLFSFLARSAESGILTQDNLSSMGRQFISYEKYCIGRDKFNIKELVKNGAPITVGLDNREKYDKNGPKKFQGISLVTDIQAEAKAELKEKLKELKRNPAISSKLNFVSEESLHMTIADLITSLNLYGNSKTDVNKNDQKKLLDNVIKPAFEDFKDEYQGREIELKARIDGIGMFPNGVLFFSVKIESDQYMELKALRNGIKKRLEEQFPGKERGKLMPETLFDDYITHITIGYLEKDLIPGNGNDDSVFIALRDMNAVLARNPIEFIIKEGKVVYFNNLDSFNGRTEKQFRRIDF